VRAGVSRPTKPGFCCASPTTRVRLRDIAASVGIADRGAYGIVADLTAAGYVVT